MWHHEKKCSFTLLPCILGHWRQTPKTTLNEPPLSYAHTKQWINARESFQECRIQCNLHTHRQSVFLLRISIDVREKKRKKRIEMDDVDIEKNNKWKTFRINCNFTKRVWFGVTWRDVCVWACALEPIRRSMLFSFVLFLLPYPTPSNLLVLSHLFSTDRLISFIEAAHLSVDLSNRMCQRCRLAHTLASLSYEFGI